MFDVQFLILIEEILKAGARRIHHFLSPTRQGNKVDVVQKKEVIQLNSGRNGMDLH